MRSCLITGVTGFIGQHLAGRLVSERFRIRGLARSEATAQRALVGVDLFRGDIRDFDCVRRAVQGADCVFHLACKVHDLTGRCDAGEHEQVTCRGTENLLRAIEEGSARSVVFISSAAVYGNETSAARDETSLCRPDCAYGRAKLQAETSLLELGRRLGIHVCCLRPSTVYGAGCKGLLPRMIKLIDWGIFPSPPSFRNRRSMVHVSDVVEAALLAAKNPMANGQCYNVTDGKPLSTREIYEMISLALGKRIPRWCVPVWVFKGMAPIGDAIDRVRGKRFLFDSEVLAKLMGSAWFSSEKISRELGYRPSLSFEEALPELIAWYRTSKV